jgi:hypothetical protein
VGGDLLEDPHVLLLEGNVPCELATAAQVVVGVGVKVVGHGGGRSLDEDPLFCLCVFCFAEPTMESDRWPVVVEGRETDRWRRRSSRLRVWSVAMGGI